MTRIVMAFALALGVAACDGTDGETETTRVEDILALTGDTTNGQAVFDARCVNCHPADGSQGIGTSLSEALPTNTDEESLDFIINGGDGMPAAGDLSDQDIADLLAYINGEWG